MDQLKIITMRLLQNIKILCVLALVPAVLLGLSIGCSLAGSYVATPNVQTNREQNLASNHNLQQVEDGVPTVGSVELKKLLEVLGLAIIGQIPGRHH